MALGAVLAAALTDHSSRFAAIYIDGLDVMKEPASAPRYAVPLPSIHVSEAGPDGVSSMDFTIECTTALPVSVPVGAEVRFDFIQSGAYRWFRGWVDHVEYQNMDGDVGTRFVVRCTGIEAILDWSIAPADFTIAAGTSISDAVLACVAQVYGTTLGTLRAFAATGGTSTQATRIQAPYSGPGLVNALTVSAGTTLREALRGVTEQGYPITAGSGTFVTVDFDGGLRYYNDGVSDIFGLTIDDDPPLTGVVAEALSYGIDTASVRAVIVKGTGVTVTVSDGSGRAGPVAVLSDATLTTVAAAQNAGASYLAQYATTARGQYTLTDFNNGIGSGFHAFSISGTITDARVGLSGGAMRVTNLDRSNFTGVGHDDVVLSFGGNPPSVTALTRQLTRTTLS